MPSRHRTPMVIINTAPHSRTRPTAMPSWRGRRCRPPRHARRHLTTQQTRRTSASPWPLNSSSRDPKRTRSKSSTGRWSQRSATCATRSARSSGRTPCVCLSSIVRRLAGSSSLVLLLSGSGRARPQRGPDHDSHVRRRIAPAVRLDSPGRARLTIAGDRHAVDPAGDPPPSVVFVHGRGPVSGTRAQGRHGAHPGRA